MMEAWVEATVGPSDLPEMFVEVDREFAQQFTTSHTRTFEVSVRDTMWGAQEVTNLISVGTRVRQGDLLVGIEIPNVETRDYSLYVPTTIAGEVLGTEVVDSTKPGELKIVRVELGWQRVLSVGDTLETDAGQLLTVAAIGEHDTAIRHCSARAFQVRKIGIARDTIAVRSIGPYSLITQRPLTKQEESGGQRVTREQKVALWRLGMPNTVWELNTIKCDTVIGRIRAYERLCFAQGEDVATLAGGGEPIEVPETTACLQRGLFAMGIALEKVAGGLRLSVASGKAIRQASHGEVLKPETINYRTFQPEPGGIMCEKIFGPVRDYKCGCGRYQGLRFRGIVCEECQVEVISSSVRRSRFGHVALGCRLPNPMFTTQISQLAGVDEGTLRDVVCHEIGFDGEPEPSFDPERIFNRCLDPDVGVPLESLEALGLSVEDLFFENLPVLPPAMRPLIPISGGRFATSDLNDLYRRVLNRRARLRKLIELDAPETILRNEIGMLYKAIEALFYNEQLEEPCLGPQKRVLVSFRAFVKGFVETLLDKPVDFSGCAARVATWDVPLNGCLVPLDMAIELFRPKIYAWLESKGQATTIKGAKKLVDAREGVVLEALHEVTKDHPVLFTDGAQWLARDLFFWDHPAFGFHPEVAQMLSPRVDIHVPLSLEARDEARGLRDDPLEVVREPSRFESVLNGDAGMLFDFSSFGEWEIDDPLLATCFGIPPR